MQSIYKAEEIINNKYQILHILGEGGVGITYAAKNIETKQLVAIKALSLSRMNDWKALELFDREAKILGKLEHPNIPSYIDSFEIDTNNNRAFYLVQQLAPGKPLSTLIESGWKPQEAEVKDIAKQILEILTYLQQLNPAIIHRDIKPQNIIRLSDGKIFLVDFGAVQDTYHHTATGGSTVVGTFGYMAPEQFRGKANITSDLYGLGTTLLYLLTRKDPSQLPQKNLKIQFRQQVYTAQDFTDWLDKMLAPASEDRFESAQEALAVLQGEKKLTMGGIKQARKPKKSNIDFKRTKDRLTVIIPPAWKYSGFCKIAVLSLVGINIVAALLTWIVLESHFLNILVANQDNQKIFYALFFWFVYLINNKGFNSILRPAFGYTHIRLDGDRFIIHKWLTNYKLAKILIRVSSKNVQRVSLKHLGEPFLKNVLTLCLIKLSTINIQTGVFLPRSEQKWLIKEMNYFLEEIRK